MSETICPKCDSPDTFWKLGFDGFTYYHCRKCKHIFPVRNKEPSLLKRIFMPLTRLIFGKCYADGHEVEERKSGVLPTRYYYKCLRCGIEESLFHAWECPDCGNLLSQEKATSKPLGGGKYGTFLTLKCRKCGWNETCQAF